MRCCLNSYPQSTAAPPELFLLALFVRCGGGSFVPRLTGEGLLHAFSLTKTGVGGTNLHGLHFDRVAIRILLILCYLYFETACKSIPWRFVPRNTATSQPKFPAKGRINREAPYKSSQGDVYPQICAVQTASA